MSEIKINVYIGFYFDDSTINANLEPHIQCQNLIDFLNDEVFDGKTEIDIYTNSPYILNKLIILSEYNYTGVKCEYFDHKVIQCEAFEVLKNGDIKKVGKYKHLISDDNLLNNALQESNDEFSVILDYSRAKKT